MRRFVTRLTPIILTGFFLVACNDDVAADSPGTQRIPITLTPPPKADANSIDLLVPLALIGPSGLPTSIENRRGGRHAKLLIQFRYPSMEALVGRGSQSTEVDLYAEVMAAIPSGTRSYAEFELLLLKDSFQRSESKICKLEEYKSNTILGSANRKHHAWVYYYYKDPRDPVSDVYIHCGDKASGDPKCRYHFDTEGGLAVLLHLVPRSRLCQWRELITRVSHQVDEFIIKGE